LGVKDADWTDLTLNGEMLHDSMRSVMKLSVQFMFPAKAKVVTEQKA
jgi:hypothetical protein